MMVCFRIEGNVGSKEPVKALGGSVNKDSMHLVRTPEATLIMIYKVKKKTEYCREGQDSQFCMNYSLKPSN